MKKILKLKFEGEDFGYVRLSKNGTFYGGGSESDAVEFELIKYKGSNTRNYFKVAGTKGYLDFSLTSSILKVTTPWMSVELSSICAWEMVGDELHAILGNKDTTKAVSRSAHDQETKALYANTFIDGHHCEVTIMEATNKSVNSKKEELRHALI